MKSSLLVIALASAALVGATRAYAEDSPPSRPSFTPPAGRGPGDMFKRTDADGDGKVTKEEFIKARTAEMEQMFARIDADGDGAIDRDEAERFAQAMRGGMPPRDGGQRPGGERPRPSGGAGPGAAGPDDPFQRLDRDGSGQLSREEFDVGLMRMREMMQRGGGIPGRPAGEGGGPAEGFRRPPRQEGEPGRP